MRIKNLLKMTMVVILVTASRGLGWGQVNIQVGETKTETFTIATTAIAALPAGWKADKNSTVRLVGSYTAAVSATEQSAGNAMSSTAANGIYNFGAGVAASATDRAIGGISSSSSSKSVNVYVQLTNNGSAAINDLTISYDVEKYRKGTNAAGFRIQMYYSTNGTTWTNAGSDFLTSFAGSDANNNGFVTAPEVSVSVSSKTLAQSIAASESLYLAWNYSVTSGTTTSNAQALGIDNVVIVANGGAPNTPPTINSIMQSPEKYVQYNNAVAVSANITDSDGTIAVAQLRWGKAAQSLNNTIPMTPAQGFYSASIPAQPNGTIVYYAVYAEDDDEVPAISEISNYQVSPVLSVETFEQGMEGYSTYSVTGDSVWMYNSETKAVEINGIGSGAVEEDWLVLPAINLDDNRMVISFDTWRSLGLVDSKNFMRLFYSTTYTGQGNPSQYTWSKVNFSLPLTEEVWTNSGNVLLPNLPGQTIYLAFKYRNNIGNQIKWSIDNIKLERSTYSVTINVVDGTNLIENAQVELNEQTMFTDAHGQVVFNLIEGNSNYNYSITKEGYHTNSGTLRVNSKNITTNITLINNKIATNIIATPGSNSTVIQWNETGAEQYVVYYKDLVTNLTYTKSYTSSPATIVTIPLTNYEVKVRTMINGAFVAFSNSILFTTTAGNNILAANIVVDNITSSSVQVSWDGEGAEEYAVNLYNVNTLTNYYTYTTSGPINMLVSPESSYEVRVLTKISGVWQNHSVSVAFTTPAGPSQLAETILVDNITSSSLRVSWSGSGADQYRIIYDDLNASTQYQVFTTLNSLTIPVTPETTFRIRVSTIIGGIWIGYSQAVVVTTPAGSQIMATNLQVDNVTSTNARVSWIGQGAEQYRVYFRNMTTLVESVVSTSTSPVIINVLPGTTYQVRIRSLIGGTLTRYSNAVEFTSPAGLKSSPEFNTFTDEVSMKPENPYLYPNPATDYINVGLTVKESTDITISIFDTRGSLIKTEKIFNQLGSIQQRIDLNNFTKGMYLVRITAPNYVETLNLIVK